MQMSRVKAVDFVYAIWCPHCVPTTLETMRDVAKELGAQYNLYDIDSEDVDVADELVKKYGDWTPDYVIPQVFLEFDDGQVRHILTGKRQGVPYTKRAVEDFL